MEAFIDAIQKGDEVNDPAVCRMLNECMNKFSDDDLGILETMVKENFEDAVMINTLGRL